METIADRLKIIRKGRPVQQMARMVGTTRQSWYGWEKNNPEIPHQSAIKLAQIEGITLDWIYRGKP